MMAEMAKISRLILVGITLFLFGCSESVDSATQNAMNACGIEIYDPEINDSIVVDGSFKSGEYVFTKPSSSVFWSVDDPLPSHRERLANWETRAISASTASKLDSRYSNLSFATTNLANAMFQLVNIKEEMLRNTSLRGYNDWSFLSSFNEDLNTWSIECSGIVEVLNQ